MDNSDQLTALERLSKLRDSGAITPEEFTAQKASILQGSATAARIPFYRRLWVVVLLTCLVITFWISLLILATGEVYRKSNGVRVPIRRGTRLVYASLLGLWLAGLVIKTAMDPGSVTREWDQSAINYKQAGVVAPPAATSQSTPATQTASSSPNVANAPNPPDTCDSTDAADLVKQAEEDSAASKLVQIKLLDFGHQKEIYFDTKTNTRYCQADAALNTGDTKLSYRLYYNMAGNQELIEVKEGEDAYEMNPQIRAVRRKLQDELNANPSSTSQTDQSQASPADASTQPQPPTAAADQGNSRN
jgi:hypothetical protein